MSRLLYQFPISHYCEKARWTLEYKNLDYEIKNLVPGLHLATMKKLSSQSHTPVLQDGDKTIQGSAEIINYLDNLHKHPPLTPMDAEHGSLAHEWENYADKNIGIPLRRVFYFHVLQDKPLARKLLASHAPLWQRAIFFTTFPGIRTEMRKLMNIDSAGADEAKKTVSQALDHIDAKLKDRKYLVGSTFSRADLSVSALLAPIWNMTEQLPPPLSAYITELKSRATVVWAHKIYKNHR